MCLCTLQSSEASVVLSSSTSTVQSISTPVVSTPSPSPSGSSQGGLELNISYLLDNFSFVSPHVREFETVLEFGFRIPRQWFQGSESSWIPDIIFWVTAYLPISFPTNDFIGVFCYKKESCRKRQHVCVFFY